MKCISSNNYAGFNVYSPSNMAATNSPAINIDGNNFPIPTSIYDSYTITRIGMGRVNGIMSLTIMFCADGTMYKSVIPMPNGNYTAL